MRQGQLGEDNQWRHMGKAAVVAALQNSVCRILLMFESAFSGFGIKFTV